MYNLFIYLFETKQNTSRFKIFLIFKNFHKFIENKRFIEIKKK